MNAELLAGFFLGALIAAPLLVRLLGWLLRGRVKGEVARGREAMPSLAGNEAEDGRAAARFDRSVDRATSALLQLLKAGADGVEAGALAARLGQPPEIVDAALRAVAAELPHRLRVTAGGALLYDFSAAELAGLRRRRRLAGPARAAFFMISALANLGAVWPLIATLVITGTAMSSFDEEGLIPVMLGAIAAVFGLALLTWILEGILRLTLSPGSSAVRLGPHPELEEGGSRWEDELVDALPDSMGGDLVELLFRPRILIMVIFIVLALSAFAGLVAWVVGLWRVATSFARRQELAPADWVRRPEPLGPFSSLIPTNDVTMQLIRSVLRAVRRKRPSDPEIASRLLHRAVEGQGRVGLLEIVLQEGLDPDEAARVGATLSAGQGGEIEVTEDGELDFVWPAAALAAGKGAKKSRRIPKGRKRAKPDELVEHEGFEYAGCGDRVPVNLFGLSQGYLRAGLRLISGAFLLSFAGCGALMELATYPAVGLLHGSGFIALVLFGLATYLLVGLAGRAARRSAETGLLRDVRRATLAEIRKNLTGHKTELDATALSARLHQTLRGPWPGAGLEAVVREVDWACIDLDLDVSLEASAEAGGATIYDLAPLAERLKGLKQARSEAASTAPPEGDDVIVFDTAAPLE